MQYKRFAYNPYNDNFFDCGDVHASAIYNRGLTSQYDNFIRGIIYNDILYLRLYYPFEDIQDKTLSQLEKASAVLLNDNIVVILRHVKREYNIIPRDIKYNVTNDILGREGICII